MNISTNDLVNLLATSNYIVYNQVIAKKLGVDEAILLGVLCSYQKHFNGQEFYREEDKLAEAKHAIDVLGGKVEDVKELPLPDTDDDRTLIVVEKIKATPKKYPRQAGTPNKKPL